MKKTIPLLITLASCSFSLFAEPEAGENKRERPGMGERRGPEGHGPGHEHHIKRLLMNLNLDESQKEIAKGLMEENAIKREDYNTQMKSLMSEMEELRQSESSDESRMIEIGGEMGKLRVKSGLLMKNFFEGLKVHLSEEQLNKYNEMKERMKKMAEFMKKRKGGPKGFSGGPGGRGFKGGPEGRFKGGPDGKGFKFGDGPKKPQKPEADEAKEPALEL